MATTPANGDSPALLRAGVGGTGDGSCCSCRGFVNGASCSSCSRGPIGTAGSASSPALGGEEGLGEAVPGSRLRAASGLAPEESCLCRLLWESGGEGPERQQHPAAMWTIPTSSSSIPKANTQPLRSGSCRNTSRMPLRSSSVAMAKNKALPRSQPVSKASIHGAASGAGAGAGAREAPLARAGRLLAGTCRSSLRLGDGRAQVSCHGATSSSTTGALILISGTTDPLPPLLKAWTPSPCQASGWRSSEGLPRPAIPKLTRQARHKMPAAASSGAPAFCARKGSWLPGGAANVGSDAGGANGGAGAERRGRLALCRAVAAEEEGLEGLDEDAAQVRSSGSARCSSSPSS
mmetsp:Transcript_61600/g.133336  ORF Transcript_61600/g.133336 Transcript_61600/m.133336 type:complete len:349 (+) Transcript_61600:799-1845(+)